MLITIMSDETIDDVYDDDEMQYRDFAYLIEFSDREGVIRGDTAGDKAELLEVLDKTLTEFGIE